MYLHTPPKTNTSPERMQVGKITFTFEMAPFLGDIRSFSGVHIVSYSYSAVHPPLETSEPQVCLGIANGRCLLYPFRVKRGEVPNRLSQLEVFKEQESFRTLERHRGLRFFMINFFWWFGGKQILILEKLDSWHCASGLSSCLTLARGILEDIWYNFFVEFGMLLQPLAIDVEEIPLWEFLLYFPCDLLLCCDTFFWQLLSTATLWNVPKGPLKRYTRVPKEKKLIPCINL